MIVVDSNVLAARCMEHENNSLAEAVFRRDPLWVTSILWRYEFQNILTKLLWAKRLTLARANEAWRLAWSQMATNEQDPLPGRVLDLSEHYRVTAYDATYVALAIEMGVPCVTEDGELQRKFPGVAISMQDFTQSDDDVSAVREAPSTYRVRKKRK